MKRWNIEEMMAIGRKLFAKIHKQKQHAHPNHDVHFLAREPDDAFDSMDVTYIRFQDDVLILCQTKRSLTRCKQRMMEVLRERGLCLSGKKTRIGSIENGFHFLGINYLGTQPSDDTNVTKAANHSGNQIISAHYLNSLGGGRTMRQLENSNLSLRKLFRMQEHCAKHANRSS